MPSGQQFFADEKKPAMGRAGWESQKELDPPYADQCENLVIDGELLSASLASQSPTGRYRPNTAGQQ
jgi:hypothetical protein